jgi:hypothetical protein
VNVLREFTDEELRDDNTFLVFLRQCDGLINGIQLKVIESQGGTAAVPQPNRKRARISPTLCRIRL